MFIANEPTLAYEGLAHTLVGQHVLRTGAGGTQRGGESQRLSDCAYRRLILSARGGAVLNGPEALTERKAGGQELMV